MEPITTKSIGLDGEVFEERRRETRRRALKGATLTFNGGYGAFECVVRNISEVGARLTFGEASAVPSRFDLAMSGDVRSRAAVVRWRSLTDVGVEFVPA